MRKVLIVAIPPLRWKHKRCVLSVKGEGSLSSQEEPHEQLHMQQFGA